MKIYLIPSPLADFSASLFCPQIAEVLLQTRYYWVEDARSARRFISAMKLGIRIDDLDFRILNKDTRSIESLLQGIPSEASIGIISEAGCPGIADPGALAVQYAHQKGIEVVPLVGASSILLALMASGMNGQSFVFHGYLPIQSEERKKAIRSIEKEAINKKQTQIFIETPYRNNQLIADMLTICQPTTLFCIAANITSPQQYIRTQSIKEWKKATALDFNKQPSVFLLG